MIKENQKIKIYICRKDMQKYYNEKGYNCEVGETIEVEAKDLSKGSHKKIKYICDYCGEEFERIPYSNSRSKNSGVKKDACPQCQTKLRKDNSLLRYGVDNPMKVPEIQAKCEKSRTSCNFEGSDNFSCYKFVSGIPVSLGQNNLAEILDFQLNFHYHKYYLDLVKNNVAIEYDGRGHDLGVRMGSISLEDFKDKEEDKEKEILENFRLLRIVDSKDKFRKKENIEPYLLQIEEFITSDECYKIIEIK